MKAYALASLKIGKKTHKASTEDEPVVVELAAKEFKRLEAMGAVREATAKEIKLAAVEDAEEAEVVEEKPATETTKKADTSGRKSSTTATKGAANGGNDTAAGGDNLDI